MKPYSDSILNVLSKNSSSFFIPPFQRAYAWGDQELDRFFDDLKKIISSKRNSSESDKLEHFFGVLVFKNETVGLASREIVVDGQQRLTTTLLLLIALRDSEENEEIKAQIENTCLKNPNSQFDEKIKLKQVTRDWDAYKALVQRTEHIPGKLTRAYLHFKSKIVNEDYTVEEYLDALTKVNVAYIVLDERPFKGEDPQIIFETLNSLGRPLTFADLIRNYILLGMESTEQADVFEKQWHPEIENVLGENLSNFFRDYLQFKNSKAFKVVSDNNTKELYGQFTEFAKQHFKASDGNLDKKALISDIIRYVPLYKYIITVDPSAAVTDSPKKNKEILELLRNIFHDIKTEAFKPLALALLEYHQYGFSGKQLADDKLIEALTVIRTYLIRRRVLKLTQGENKDIPRLCGEIRNNANFAENAEAEMLRLLSKGIYHLRIPNDSEINDELIRIDFYNSLKKYSKFILGKIEEKMSKVAVDFRDSMVTIEHVMPQKIEKSNSWKKELGDDWEGIHKVYLHNIGNLILTEFNSEMGNKPLADKKKKLETSNLKYRTDVTIRPNWNKQTLQKHQKEMIKRFLDTFPLPEDMRDSDNWNTEIADDADGAIYPFDQDISEIATNRKPKSIIINNEATEVKYWQDAYLVFLRWVTGNEYSSLMELHERMGQIGQGKFPDFATRKTLDEILCQDDSVRGKYKRLSDSEIYGYSYEEFDENDEFALINLSAFYITSRIKTMMGHIGLPDESVLIELEGDYVEEPIIDA